ncbi:MAG: winged helix-turn-helix domain-containing protein [Anaerolineae bacterium]|nr:winged helix-turn-helix domain-containing protein [Anaerolineae bacterium]
MLYQSTDFRKNEIEGLLKLAQAGESASIIGVSGIGKSNLFNHLLDEKTRRQYFGDSFPDYILVRVNFHYLPDFKERSVYSLILDQLELLEEQIDQLDLAEDFSEKIALYHEQLLEAGDDLLKVQRYFKLAVRQLLRHSSRKLIFLFDQFDELFQEVEPRFFANLRGLREAYKYRIVFFVFTRNQLPELIPLDNAREEFFELLSSNLVGLTPYNQQDANLLIERIVARNHTSLNSVDANVLYALSGGHAGLLRALLLLNDDVVYQADEPHKMQQLLDLPSIDFECKKIWASLSFEEREILFYIAQNKLVETYNGAVAQLKIKGLVEKQKPHQIFSPIFSQYVMGQPNDWNESLRLDTATRRVWVFNRPSETLTSLEYRVFQTLYYRDGEVVTRDDIVEAGWPDAQGGVTDDAVTQIIRRLREKIEPDRTSPQFIESVRGQGYKLVIA